MEIWQTYLGNYQVSNKGRLRNKKTGHVLKLFENSKGYLKAVVGIGNKKTKTIIIHRAVAEMFLEKTNSNCEVSHIDGNKKNNEVNNLQWSEHKNNMNHAVEIGTMNNKHEKNGSAKLTMEKALKIRELYATKEYSSRKLGELFSISKTNVLDIVHNRIWV